MFTLNLKSLSSLRLVKTFVIASKKSDILTIDEILDDSGVYEILSKDSKVKCVEKTEFLKWYNIKLERTKIKSVVYDKTIVENSLNDVVILNNGEFPKIPLDLSDNIKTGFMFNINKGKINSIKFCHSFLKTYNSTIYEVFVDKCIFYCEFGYTMEEAMIIYNNNPKCKFRHITKKYI
jgi:hypothetical protein